MHNKIVSVCLFIILSTLVACDNVSLSVIVPTPTASTSAQATFDYIRASITEEQEAGMQQGNEIVMAIEKYYQETNRYPDNLNKLMPAYLVEIPLTMTGEQFEYKLVKPQLYYLSFLLRRQSEKFACTYMGDLKAWECSGTGD